MNPRNFLNVGLALALAGLVVLVVIEPGKETPVNDIKLTKINPDNIQRVVIKQSQQPEIVLIKILIKTNNQWQMREPYSNQANTLRINKLLKISRARSHAQYSATDINLEQLKLSAPDLSISLDDTTLSFGTTDALNGHRYIQIKNTVHLITDRFSHLIRGQASKLLSPALLPKNTVITKLVLPQSTLQANESGWQTSPANKSISADNIQQLLDEWRFARALRVSKIMVGTDGKNAGDKSIAIEVHTNTSQLLRFDLMQTEDEIILLRADIGLRYHFDIGAGERLLKPPSTKSDLTKPD